MQASDTQKLIDYVYRAGDRLRQKAGQITDLRAGKLWVTEEDVAIERELSALVKDINPRATIFAEEEHDMFEQGDDVWIIDPISHTFNFIHGLPHYAVSIARMVKDEVVFALVYDVSMDEIFMAKKGQGTTLNGRAVQVQKNLESAAILYDPKSGGEHTLESNMRLFTELTELGWVKSFGSLALHYAYVSCGRAQAAVSTTKDAFPEFAGSLLVQEAGGVFTDFQGNPLTIHTRHIAAACSVEFHQQIMATVAKN